MEHCDFAAIEALLRRHGFHFSKSMGQNFLIDATIPAAIAEATANVTNYEGLTGNITIDPDTHMPTGLEMVMFTYEGSTPVMLERYTVQD